MYPEHPYNEKELLAQAASGHEPAFQQLFEKYWPRMYANALRFSKSPELAQDLTQEIFIKIWTQREKLRTVERFDAWLYTVSRNLIYNELRKKMYDVAYTDYLYAYFEDENLDAQQLLELKELEQQINQAINHLPPQVQAAFRLSRFQGLSHEQIARELNITRITSQNYIARALLALRKQLDANRGATGALLCLFFVR